MGDTNSPETTEDQATPDARTESEERFARQAVSEIAQRTGVDVGREDVHHSSNWKGKEE